MHFCSATRYNHPAPYYNPLSCQPQSTYPTPSQYQSTAILGGLLHCHLVAVPSWNHKQVCHSPFREHAPPMLISVQEMARHHPARDQGICWSHHKSGNDSIRRHQGLLVNTHYTQSSLLQESVLTWSLPPDFLDVTCGRNFRFNKTK